MTHQERYYRFTTVELLPKPVQQPVPIYMAINPREARVNAATIDRILHRVATHANGWQTDATPVDTFHQRFDTIRDYAACQWRDPSSLESCLHLRVNINADRAIAFWEAETFLRSDYGAGAVSHERAELWLAYGPPPLTPPLNSLILLAYDCLPPHVYGRRRDEILYLAD